MLRQSTKERPSKRAAAPTDVSAPPSSPRFAFTQYMLYYGVQEKPDHEPVFESTSPIFLRTGETSMNGQNTNSQRRQALKKILAGSSIVGASTVVPNQWVKPVVNAVVLPAHAQASPVLPNAIWSGGSNNMTSLERRSEEGLVQRVLDQIVPAAQAQDSMSIATCSATVSACLTTVSADQVSVQLFVGPLFGSKNATVVNRQFQETISAGKIDYMVDATLSSDAKTWTLRVQGPCPPIEVDNKVASDAVFTGERIDVAALELAQVRNFVEYENLDVTFDAGLTSSCPA